MIAAADSAHGAGQPDLSLEVYGRPQQLVDIGGRRLNLYCLGHGSPTIILVGGLAASTFTWRKVHAELARTTRVCAYDRAGYGFSDSGPLPRDTRHLADDLAALTKANIKSLRACLAVLKAGVPAPGSKAAADCVDTPNPEFPAAVNAHLMQSSSHPPLYRESLSEEEEAIGAGSDQVAASKRSYGDLPLIVLTAPAPDSPTPNGPDPEFLARGKIVTLMHEEVARLSSRGVNRTVPGASHRIMLSAPQAVIDAVYEVVTEVRQQRAADVASKDRVR